ncbi:ubiquitin carboxyl-terminal hydrolase 15-like [Cynara cardunculus var. scolymus]|uniref:ubiquitin carboxyl-terminal hydrolase 15-like n=1 Tax=Cynara cardunculus var. scolymus TaxID=59895 RepID=UPI000D626C13|nr:ubiquitin carboxyl-terminal hydrolase 15-like [Cynara cardunculus var. scolymus]XP_024960748.1 ubiquitin carboxyl-terminal hydrolase 15-like [Cynara cardunculus var. scolymus]
MLQPRETDLPALFLVLVVLPLVAYILLGKWSEVSKKKDRISELAQIAAEEAFRAEAMAAAAAVIIPIVPVSKSSNGFHKCSRCFGPAKTRCSRCKSVRYCSGKCQIIHWRQVHKQECQVLDYNSSCASSNSASNEDSVDEQFLFGEKLDSQFSESNMKPLGNEKAAADDIPVEICSTSYDNIPLKGTSIRYKPKRSHSVLVKEDIPEKSNADVLKSDNQHGNVCNITSKFGFSDSEKPVQNGANSLDVEKESEDGWSLPKSETIADYETYGTRCSERSQAKKSGMVKPTSHSTGTKMHKSTKSTVKMSRDRSCSERGSMDQIADAGDSRAGCVNPLPHEGNGIVNKGFMKIIGLKRSSKHERVEHSEVHSERHKKIKMLFPYEEFVKFFRCEAFDLLPRGLVNCGNSCYANAVLQCLTSTKPLIIYLLRRSHSRACCAKSWCLICELEHHAVMLCDNEEPLSLSRILLHMRSVNNQIGDGSQEDAHEFLRLLVTSMQSICLEGLGGEAVVDLKLQETTFIQHTFGGQLRSKVKCLRCHCESDRYENIMDLTLEIFGWVESLEDALTQFTSPEDLDGENMYRCGRCAAYVRAQKQLAIHEAPNILTIVLKRFQEGNYGKINKCITFPDMLDMIPYMTGTDDVPPLYMLYGVVVHLDTMNASFSGHYISYVKDLHGNWFRIDDTQVQPVPLSQVMSEGAYILFYMRSSPRPLKTGKPKASGFEKHRMPKSPNPTSDQIQESKDFQAGSNRNRPPSCVDFSDANSSDWSSIFTSSDDASFTTESTRDSFSTIDHTDNDPISSIFNTIYAPPDYTASCSRYSRSRPHLTSKPYQDGEPPYRLPNVRSSDSSFHCRLYMKYESDHKDAISRTSGHCTL